MTSKIAYILTQVVILQTLEPVSFKMATGTKKIRKSADTEPVGRGFGFGFVPAGTGAGTTSNPMGIC